MAFCPGCGAKVAAGIKFCPKCGVSMAGDGGGAGTNVNITHNILAAICLFIWGALLLYGAIQLSQLGISGVALFANIPVALLCLYFGYESLNRKEWVQKWTVVLGIVTFLSSWATLANPAVSWLQVLYVAVMVGAAVFAYIGKDLYTVADPENPFAKLMS